MSNGKGIQKGMQEMLGLPLLEDILRDQGVEPLDPEETPMDEQDNSEKSVNNTLDMADRFERDMMTVGGVDHGKSLDNIYKETFEHARTLMDLAYNVDERSRRGLAEIAASMYKNAMDAKNSKRDMELKFLKLKQDERKQELEEAKFRNQKGEIDNVDSSVVIVADRNELIRKAIAESKNKPN